MLCSELNLCNKYTQLNFRRFLSDNRTPLEILSDVFGFTMPGAKAFIERHRLNNKDAEMLMNSVKICGDLGYSYNDMLTTPALLRIHPLELEQHYLTLEEGGFQTIGPKILARARIYMKRIIKSLKLRNVIPKTTDVPRNFMSYIKDQEIVENISLTKFSDDQTWNGVHKSILETFLKHRLKASEDEIIKLFRIHRMIKNKSFRVIQENIAMAEELGFDEAKILKFGYLLHNYPKYPRTVLKQFPNLAGADMRKAMRLYPKLVMTSPTNIIKIYGILKEFEIEDEVIQKQMNVFHMSPETVKFRLQEIERSPDFKVLLSHPRILSLIVHHNRAKSRLSYLQQLQLRCASLTVLRTDDKEAFNEYVREGKDINKTTDLIEFLKKLLNGNGDYIKSKIKNHPFYLQVPLKDMQATYDYLILQHFEPADILKVLYILLYPKEKIAKALNDIANDEKIDSKNLSQVKKLSLILYFIEKEFHFTGNGIWTKFNSAGVGVHETTLE